MLDKWTGEVIGTLHIHEIAIYELADKMGISLSYLSSILHCRRRTPDAEFNTRRALAELIEERNKAS